MSEPAVNVLARVEDWSGLRVSFCNQCDRCLDILSGDVPLCDCAWNWSRFIPNTRLHLPVGMAAIKPPTRSFYYVNISGVDDE